MPVEAPAQRLLILRILPQNAIYCYTLADKVITAIDITVIRCYVIATYYARLPPIRWRSGTQRYDCHYDGLPLIQHTTYDGHCYYATVIAATLPLPLPATYAGYTM